ncbi:hypothetical protein QVD17_27333 [Tagetes erecta]|uniref:Uncharacterized protein n=1 Tax=Tagetes erecta TaxID=13708 RepID=A0AAD8K892_TARER|nr:hypothetical protein QVD17_27333 [Tagetes erecta]
MWKRSGGIWRHVTDVCNLYHVFFPPNSPSFPLCFINKYLFSAPCFHTFPFFFFLFPISSSSITQTNKLTHTLLATISTPFRTFHASFFDRLIIYLWLVKIFWAHAMALSAYLLILRGLIKLLLLPHVLWVLVKMGNCRGSCLLTSSFLRMSP